MIGAIQATKQSQSGKTISIQIGGQWYSSKNWELAQNIGRTVIFEPSQSEYQGQIMHWLNDYVFEDVGTGPAAQAMNAALAQQPHVPQGPAPQSGVNKDAMIGAFAMTKACIPSDPETVQANFLRFYAWLSRWDGSVPKKEAPQQDFDDDIPY